ncbi:MAG: HDIG domain-containing protein [Bacteroidales bacterium]|nr:HDIG domain-containing protein [Bacteroidales bacterium]
MSKLLSIIVKHLPVIYKVLAVLVVAVLIQLMFPARNQGTHYDYTEGGYWRSEDLYAPYDFNIIKSQNELDNEAAAARQKAILYYTADSNAHAAALRRLDTYMATHHNVAHQRRALKRTIDSIYSIGYIELPRDIASLEGHTVVLLSGNVGSELSVGSLVTTDDIANPLLRDSIMQPSLRFDEVRTSLELDSRLSQIQYASNMASAGELIIAKGERVTAEKVQVLQSLEAENDRRFDKTFSPLGYYLGQLLLSLLAFVTLFLFLRSTRHIILESSSKMTFILLTILIAAAMVALVVSIDPEWVLMVPMCIVPIIIFIFFDMRVALYAHLTIVIILASHVPNSFEFIFYQLITGMMSIISVRDFDKRSRYFTVALMIFLTYSLIYIAGLLSQESNLSAINYHRFLLFFINALLTLMAYPLIFIFERIFHITTGMTLMEMSSTNTPALRELSRSAPGTFQHSMQVANITEDLVNEIGGNALLAKVGALYHDIGKVQSPLYFTENQNSGFNPHNELDYTESARLITSHVTAGLELARKYHLPAEVADFIRTHHGTTYTGYFYAKQKQEHPDQEIDDAVFRYPGPRPYSRETAVVMIVDSVEAACKSLKQHDKEHIDRLVDSIIDSKINDGQLSNCPLTFGDISRIRKMLKEKMLSIYHARITYPTVKSEKQEPSV